MDTVKFSKLLFRIENLTYSVANKDGDEWEEANNEIRKTYRQLLDWFDEVQPLIELGKQAQWFREAQEQAQQD